MMTKTNSSVQMAIPPPVFTQWFPWSYIDGAREHIADDLRADLRQVGCYLLARFDGHPPEGAADPTNSKIFYIGETHGRTTNLRRRLQQFGNSAGFYGGQWNGSYAAWAYPWRFEEDNKGPGKDGAGRACDPSKVFIALCPWRGAFSQEMRGIFAVLVEQQSIWLHTAANKKLPDLNNSARTVIPPLLTMPPANDLTEVLGYKDDPGRAEAAACRIAQHLALRMEYSASPEATIETEGNWRGTVRHLEKRDYLCIGWLQGGLPEVYLEVYRGKKFFYGGEAASNVEQFKRSLQAFWDYWTDE